MKVKKGVSRVTVEEKLQEYLIWSGVQQKDLARLSGISKSSISGYVRGERKMTVEALQKIAAALDVSVWTFLNGDPLMVKPIDVTAEECKLLSEYRMLNGEERKLINHTLDMLNSKKLK